MVQESDPSPRGIPEHGLACLPASRSPGALGQMAASLECLVSWRSSDDVLLQLATVTRVQQGIPVRSWQGYPIAR